MLGEGDLAPEFDLPAETGDRIALSEFRGRWLVLYFYPKDDTEGCTIEAKEFSDLTPSFARRDVTVVGVSPDSVKSHDKFRCKHGLKVRLASDEDKVAAHAYGVWVEKQMYGRTFMGVERSTFLISPKGRLVRIWRKAPAKGHAADVLDAVTAATSAG
jgi:thioredoxin-dependent peroxiredoxin